MLSIRSDADPTLLLIHNNKALSVSAIVNIFLYIISFITQFVFRLKMPKKRDFVFITIEQTTPNNKEKKILLSGIFCLNLFVSVWLFSGY